MPEAAYEKAFYVKGTCAGMAVSWMEHEAIGMAVQSAWCGFKIWRRLATCVKWRRKSAKWKSRALLGRDCGLQDGQAQGVRFYYSLSGQVPPQV